MTDAVECGGSEKNMGTVNTLLDCADSCRKISSMFIYGTNDFGETNVKQMVRKTAHVIVKHHLKTGIADGLIIAGIFSTNMLDAKKVKETKLTKHKTSLYLIERVKNRTS